MKSYFSKSQFVFIMALVGFSILGKVQAADSGALQEPVKAVLTKYEKIQQSLAKDSLQQVADNASGIAKAIRDDPAKSIALSVAERAEKLAGAKDIKSARAAFKPLSESLIGYLADNKIKATGFKEVYCPMAEGSWLQKAQAVQNPYMGKSMLTCGDVKRTF